MLQELIGCIIFLVFLFISFIVTAVNAWIDAAIGAVCVSYSSAIFVDFSEYLRRMLVETDRN